MCNIPKIKLQIGIFFNSLLPRGQEAQIKLKPIHQKLPSQECNYTLVNIHKLSLSGSVIFKLA